MIILDDNESDKWLLLEAYPTNPITTLKRLIGPSAQLGLMYVY